MVFKLLSFWPTDPLNTMYRTESDPSIGDSDENIMERLTEGGVTIKQQLERKKQVTVSPVISYAIYRYLRLM